MPAHEILRQIESAGYRVTGYRDAIGDEIGSLLITAENLSTGQRHTVTVSTKDESEALRQLADEVGMHL
jgi:hypothetical protein